MNRLMLNTFQIPGYGLKVTANLQIATEDMSGTSSSTTVAENGFKPKTFNVVTTIRFRDQDDLTELTRQAESVDGNGQRTIFTVSHPTTRAMNVRQVRFSDNFSVTPAEGLKAWQIAFTIKEYDSASERMEARTRQPAAFSQGGTGSGIPAAVLQAGVSAAVSGSNTGKPELVPVQMTDIEKVLQSIDGFLS